MTTFAYISKERMIVEIFIPCFIDQLYPQTGFNFVKILEKAGCTIHYNPEQSCCGQPAFNSGYNKETTVLAKKFVTEFDVPHPIVSPGGSCSGFIRNHYPQLLKDTKEAHACEKLKDNIFELTDFLVNTLHCVDLGAEFNAKVTFHDACSALREYGLNQEPRLLLSKVKGLELVEMNDSDVCCGFGGTFSVKHVSISSAMVEQKVQNAIATGAQYIVTTESSCMLNIEGYIKKHNLPIKTIHIADILASGI
jgi:L-lactate dehydrogenase complex protein LldE